MVKLLSEVEAEESLSTTQKKNLFGENIDTIINQEIESYTLSVVYSSSSSTFFDVSHPMRIVSKRFSDAGGVNNVKTGTCSMMLAFLPYQGERIGSRNDWIFLQRINYLRDEWKNPRTQDIN